MVPGEQQLGRYRLLKLIATGGMGEIHLAEDSSINRQVAIKVIRSEITPYAGEGGSSDAARLFEREAKAIAMLDHPHILPLYDYGEQKKDGIVLTYLVMPYRPEGSLATWLEQRGSANPLSLEDVESIILQTASALQYTHEHQVIHQDVKPSNFLIRTNKEHPNRPDILVSDFGIARLSNMTSGASQSIRGTPGYMAPEQWAGTPLAASDQYALAVMAYELVTGSQPFKGNPMQMMYAHVNTLPQAPSRLTPGLPSALDAVILRGLAKKPEDRYPTIIAFAQAFQQAVRGSLASQVSLANPYTPAHFSPSGNYSGGSTPNIPQTPGGSDLFTTLAISADEAFNGSNRVLTLPDGSQISVRIPAGAQHGQILDLNNPNGGTDSNSLRLKLSVQTITQQGNRSAFSQERSLPANDALTYDSSKVSRPSLFTNAPTAGISTEDTRNPTVATHWQGEGLLPPSGGPTPSAFGQSASAYNAQYAGSSPAQFASTPSAPFYPGISGAAAGSPMPSAPFNPPPARPRRSSNGLLITLIIVALLLILGGGVLIYAVNGASSGTGSSSTPGVTATDNSSLYATQTALANAGQAAQSTATANAQGTASSQGTANVQSTAGAQASATAQSQANASATASATNPYGGTLVLDDPLVDNGQGHNWTTSSDSTVGSSCQFTDNAYHMVMPGNYGGSCLGSSTNFSNFALQVQMTFFKYGQHFSGEGLIFRGTTGDQYYVLEIFASGQYTFFSCNGNDCSHGIAGYPSSSLIASFQRGLNQTNTIVVVAQGTTFTFYCNGEKFAGPLTDSTYTSGTIGFYAEGGSEGGPGATTDVAYSKLKVWQL
ncbi:MAG TPA: protein kinase [Ktedonobacteraceae bacterium]